MSKAVIAVRVLLGVSFFVFGLNGFLHFFNPPPPDNAAAQTFGAALYGSGYLFQMMSVTEIVVAVMLIAGRFVPLALVLLAPILVNIVAFHVFLDMKGIGLGAFFMVLEIFLAWAYRDSFKQVLAMQAQPTVG